MRLIILVTLLFVNTFINGAVVIDSLRQENRNGQTVIIHQVEEKETLFGLSRRYNTSIEQIQAANPSLVDGLKIGNELAIPISSQQEVTTNLSSETTTHFVDIGETLFAISRKYGVSVDDLKIWNNLPSNELNVGQQLTIKGVNENPQPQPVQTSIEEIVEVDTTERTHIVEIKETLFSISQKYGLSVQELIALNSLEGNELSIGQILKVKSDEAIDTTSIELPIEIDTTVQQQSLDTSKVEPQQELIPINASDVNPFNSRTVQDGELKKIFEEGLAMVIENSTETKKYLALHRSADVGTVMRVKNMANSLSIFVRVVGKLPETGNNSRILLKLSRAAYERLGAVDAQFPVEISYIP
ncbi:MAG: LysM peptidoglycan-binding domain-containing protein [Cyclobacteriaceae bacterium]